MTMPNMQGTRLPNGSIVMPGGYDQAIQVANNGQPVMQQGQPMMQQQVQQQVPVQQVPLTQLGQPAAFAPTGQPLIPNQVSPLQPGQQVQQQVPQQQFQLPANLPADLNARLYGQNIPAELQGRTVGEVIGIANGLRQVHLNGQLQAPARPAQTQVPALPVQGQPAQNLGFNWTKPDESIGRVVDEKLTAFEQRLAPMFQPLIQQGAVTAAQSARDTVARETPGFAQLEPMVLARMQGLPADQYASADAWRIATRVVIGDLAIRGAGQPQGQQVQQVQNQQAPQGQPGPAVVNAPQFVQQGQSPLPNLNGFYTEPPFQGGQGPQGAQMSQNQMNAAAAMGMTNADYMAWAGGVNPAINGGRR